MWLAQFVCGPQFFKTPKGLCGHIVYGDALTTTGMETVATLCRDPQSWILLCTHFWQNRMTFTFHMFNPIFSLLSSLKLSILLFDPHVDVSFLATSTTSTQHLQGEKTRAHTLEKEGFKRHSTSSLLSCNYVFATCLIIHKKINACLIRIISIYK
jgi:hypothetical protein